MTYKAFAIAAGTNTELNDAKGAFIPGAQKFSRGYQGGFATFDNAKNAKANFFASIEAAPSGLDLFAYFGHGYTTQLESAKIYTQADITQFGELLKKKLNPGAVVVLYACWAGAKSGVTTMLQKALGNGAWVYGHTTKGHSFTNPEVSEVQTDRDPSFRVIYGQGHPLRDPWVVALQYTDMWLRFPLMYDSFIDLELYAIRLLGSWQVEIAGQTSKYLFSWSKTNGIYGSLEDMNVCPSGTVFDEKSRRRGSWRIDQRQVEISWGDGKREAWPLPLRSEGTRGTSGNDVVKAKRLVRNNPGVLQG